MNIQNSIHINQHIDLNQLGAVSQRDVGRVYDSLMERVNALSAVVEMLADCQSQSLDAGKMYFLLSGFERDFNEVLVQMEEDLLKH